MTQTTISKLEEIIESFKDEKVKVDGIGNEAATFGETVEIRELRDGDLARGQCAHIAEDFEKFARSHGFVARFEDLGDHTASSVVTDDGEFLVDFTATQFGNQFPMIAKKRREELDLEDDEVVEGLEGRGYSEWAPNDPYGGFDFIAIWKPV